MSEYLKTNRLKVGGITYEIEDSNTRIALDKEVTRAQTVETELEERLNTLQGTGEGSISEMINEAVAEIIDSAPETFDTLKEISDWIQEDETGTEALLNRVTALETQSTTTTEKILWSDLVQKINNSELTPGQNYRITDYVTTTSQENTQSAEHPFDVIVEAINETTLNENAKACLRDGDTYFNKNKLTSWEIKYCVKNDTTRFGWAKEDGKGVIYYMKDEFNNEAWYDFKNIKFLRTADWFRENSLFTAAGTITENTYFYTFSRIEDGNIIDDSLGTGNYPASDNHLGRNTAKLTKLNNTIFIGNGPFNNILADGHGNNTFGFDIWNNIIEHNFLNNIINKQFQYNNISTGFSNNNCFGSFTNNEVGSNCYSNNFKGNVNKCNFNQAYYYNNFIGESLSQCTFGSGNNWISDIPSMSNITITNNCISGNNSIYLKDLASTIGQSLLDTIVGLSNEINHVIYKSSNNKYGVFSYETSEYIYNLGNFNNSSDAELKAVQESIAFDKNKIILKYTVSDRVGSIYQQINNDDCYQILYWDGKKYSRTVTKTTIGITKTNWVELKDITTTDKERLDWLVNNEVPTKSYVDEKTYLAAYTNVDQSTVTTPRDYVGKFSMCGLKKSTTVGLNYENAGEYVGLVGFNAWRGDTGGNNKVATHEIAFCGNGDIKVRSARETATDWSNCEWRTLIDSRQIATTTSNGLMTSEDKTQLEELKVAVPEIRNIVTEDEQVIAHAIVDLNNRINNIFNLGTFKDENEAENVAKSLEIATRLDITTIKYQLADGKTGIIDQSVDPLKTVQVALMPNGQVKKRILQFQEVDGIKTLINDPVWVIIKDITENDWNDRLNGAVLVNEVQTINSSKTFTEDIILNNKSDIKKDIDSGEFKLLHHNSQKGFILRTKNTSDNILPIELLSIGDGYDSLTYNFPTKTGGNLVVGAMLNNNTYTADLESGIINLGDEILNTVRNITYSELVELRDNEGLIPGQKYRITDYVTTTGQGNTQSAGHRFDIIVEALSENTLSEDAKAIQNENDEYFNESNLEAWELKYCLDNDFSRFAWAIENKTIITENYRIKPELINGNTFVEPFAFDGQILIDTAELVYEDSRGDIIYEWGYETEPNGENSLYIIKNGVGYENEDMDYNDKHYYRGTINIEGEIYDEWEKYEVNQGGYYASTGGTVYFLTKSIVEEGSSEITIGGKGVIYYMKDEFNNECPYDFKNIQFVRYKLNPPTVGGYNNEWQNQLSKNVNKMFENNQLSYIWHGSNSEAYYWEDEIGEVFSTAAEETKAFYTFSNVINNEITDKSLTNVCYSNVIKENYVNNVLELNNNIFFSEHINNYCNSNSFGNYCNSNSFGNYCNSNSFGNDCYSNSFGDYCNYNSFDNDCNYNSFGNYCNSNSFGNDCYYNSFGNYCNSNSFGNYCNYNSFGNDCNYNSFGNDCNSNSFGNDCNYNSFGNYCNSNGFYDDASYVYNEDVDDNVGDGNRLNYVQYVTLNEGCHHLLFHTTESDQEHKVQNITVTKGVKSIVEDAEGYFIPLAIEIPVTNNEYELKIARNSNGDIKMYCEADLIG